MAINPQLEKIDPILLKQVEADTYWSLCKFLESILDNYTQYQPGLKRFHERLVDITTVLDKKLINHLQEEKIDLFGFVFKWSNCVLLRLFSFEVGLRLFDTYMAEEQNYSDFSLFIIVTILMRFSKKLQKLSFEDIMFLLERLPTKQWTEHDLNLCLAEAYTYQKIFQKK